MALEVRCEEHLEAVRAYADSLGEKYRAQLEEKLSWLGDYTCFGNPCTTILTKDFAPYSFEFAIMVTKNGKTERWMNGGLIYHGPRSTGVDFPELAVTLSPHDEPHWQVHT